MKGRKLDTETSLFWVKVKSTMLHHAPHESIGGCLSPSSRPWTNKWRENHCHWLVATVTPDPWLPAQPQGITAHWLVPNYTACWQIHMCVFWVGCSKSDRLVSGPESMDVYNLIQSVHHIQSYFFNEKKCSERCKHCALGIVTWSQKSFNGCTPPSLSSRNNKNKPTSDTSINHAMLTISLCSARHRHRDAQGIRRHFNLGTNEASDRQL